MTNDQACGCETCLDRRIVAVEDRLLVDAAFRETIPQAVLDFLLDDLMNRYGDGADRLITN